MLELNSVLQDRYRIISYLARGGMGDVYQAEHVKYSEFKVAIKVLDATRTQSQEEREVFRNEVIAGYRVSHENIIKVYEYFDESDFQAYAMEYLPEGDLLHRLEHGETVPFLQAAGILKQCALGLSALHRSGTIHRDIKPANILFSDQKRLKITDFGVALIRGGRDCARGRVLAGTPKYMAPEYVETGKCDHRADIYALGVIAYELCSGTSPFSSTSDEDLLKERLEVRGQDLSDKMPEIPREMSDLVGRLMARSLTERFYDVMDAAKSFEKIIGSAQVAVSENRASWIQVLSSQECNEAQEKVMTATMPAPSQKKPKRWGSLHLVVFGLVCALVVTIGVPTFLSALFGF